MASIIDYGSTFLTVDGPVLGVGVGQGITTTSVHLDPANPATYHSRVELKASFGVNSFSFTDDIRVDIYRGATKVYSSPLNRFFEPGNNLQIVNVLAVDGGLPGTQIYTLGILFAASNNPGSIIQVVGPITFTATAIGL
ncbi:hypothetical protein [Paenibacillus sp. FSL R10-2734]|uniref:hypothetical protein n=1 Tax=Paenibacillus sp. FSL R10-2734 TaxID=2954691 RepID=UPI0030D838B3